MTTNNTTQFITFQQQHIGLHGTASIVFDVARRFQVMLSSMPINVAGWVTVRTGADAIIIDVDWRQESFSVHSEVEAVQIIEHEISLWFMRLQSGYFWLHAGAAAWQKQAILFLGEWGQGKSSLVTELHRQQWCYCSDDLVPWRAFDNRVLAFPQTPRVRRPVQTILPRAQVNRLSRQTIPLTTADACQGEIPVMWVVDLKYDAQSKTQLRPLPPSQAVLAMTRALINQDRHRQTAVSHFVRLFSHIPAYQLIYNDRKEAADLVAQQFKTQNSQPMATLPAYNLATMQST